VTMTMLRKLKSIKFFLKRRFVMQIKFIRKSRISLPTNSKDFQKFWNQILIFLPEVSFWWFYKNCAFNEHKRIQQQQPWVGKGPRNFCFCFKIHLKYLKFQFRGLKGISNRMFVFRRSQCEWIILFTFFNILENVEHLRRCKLLTNAKRMFWTKTVLE